MSSKELKVVFNPKSPYQKEDCYFCNDKATLQADCGSASIRCCEKCKAEAAKFALEAAKMLPR